MRVTIPDELDGARLDKALGALADLSRAHVRRVIESGAVRVNGRRFAKGGQVAKGDVVSIDDAALSSARSDAPAVATAGAPLVVRYETDTVAVVDKPAGQPTAPLREGEEGTLVNAILGRYPELARALEQGEGHLIGHSPREPGIVHRLDTDTSGLVVVARTRPAFDELKAALREGRFDKRYLLVCPSEGLPDSGTIEHPIAKHPKDQRRVYPCIHPRDVMRYEPRPAVTRYTVVRREGPWAVVEASVSRALRHQIRAHFASIGHPLAGDELYGGAPVRALRRHALHASRVIYVGAAGGVVDAFDVVSPLPDELTALLHAS
jgi:23S rRNA pseudouridine1911/1915/1917 synthase